MIFATHDLPEIGVTAAAVIALATLVLLASRGASFVVRRLDWISSQMVANGTAARTGAGKDTIREVNDKQMELMVVLAKSHERVEENQKNMGRRLKNLGDAAEAQSSRLQSLGEAVETLTTRFDEHLKDQRTQP